MRREYVAQTAGAHIRMMLGVGMMIVCGILGLLNLFVTLVLLIGILVPSVRGLIAISLYSTMIFVCLSAFGCYIAMSADRKLSSVPYVPPVSEQLAALPAEEILLRGSQASPASPQELLRPAGKQETPAEELLRAGYDEHNALS